MHLSLEYFYSLCNIEGMLAVLNIRIYYSSYNVLFHLLLVKILWAALWKQFTNFWVRINDQDWSYALYYCCFYSDMIWSSFTFNLSVFCANLEKHLAIQLTLRHRLLFLVITLFLSTWYQPTRESGNPVL